MSSWKFHSSKDTNSLNGQSLNRITNESVSHSLKKKQYFNPFEARPKVGRTPIVLNKSHNLFVQNNNKQRPIGQSPIISSYFIPNTPKNINYHHQRYYDETKKMEEIMEDEPGSATMSRKRRRRRRSSGISSQPEGIYSPIPKSKILDELNQSINGMNIDCDMNNDNNNDPQSPISMINDEEQKDIESSSEITKSFFNVDAIRDEVLAEIQKMDDAITKEMNETNLLLNPSSSSLLSQMSKLQISEHHELPLIHNQPMKKQEINLKRIGNHNQYERNYKMLFGGSVFAYCLSKDLWLNILDFFCIVFVLVLYWNVIDSQWT